VSQQGYYAHPTAVIDEPCRIGAGTKVWHFCHVMEDAQIGEDCSLGQNVFVASGVVIGNHVKIQNNVSVYAGVQLEDDVFCGPSCVFTNVSNPRAQIVRRHMYEKTLVRRGATIGANATIVCGATLGQYSFVGAGAVVRRDVPDYGLVVGVPGRQVGWMSRHGYRLPAPDGDGVMVCPESGWRYREASPGVLRCLDWPEDEPLPEKSGGGG
jgi:UDP-2-acetamido-3-amino-2,3-dideoxy-glucuronate N-acetyltransferase